MKSKFEKQKVQNFNKKMKLKGQTFTMKDIASTSNKNYSNIS